MNLESDFFQVEQLEKQRSDDGKRYLEFIRVPAMSAGLYVLPGGGQDPQKPHNEDELYYVVRGRARVRVGSEDRDVGPGSIIFVGAKVQHQFHEIAEEVAVLVFFAPAES